MDVTVLVSVRLGVMRLPEVRSRVRKADSVLLFTDAVTYSCEARPVRADIVWPTAKEGVKDSAGADL